MAKKACANAASRSIGVFDPAPVQWRPVPEGAKAFRVIFMPLSERSSATPETGEENLRHVVPDLDKFLCHA